MKRTQPVLTRRHLVSLLLLALASVASAWDPTDWDPTDFFAGTGYSAVASGYEGDTDCPCIDPFSDPYNVTNLGSPAADTPHVPASYDPGSGGTDECAWIRAPGYPYGQICFPSAYGAQGCKAYDMTMSPECGGLPAHECSGPGISAEDAARCTAKCPDLDFESNRLNVDCNSCASTWCFVDPRNCRRPHATSSYFPDATYGTDGPNLTYSYETCGNVDTWQYHRKRLDELKRLEPIRISFPGNDGSVNALRGSNPQLAASPPLTLWSLPAVPRATPSKKRMTNPAFVHLTAT